MERIRSSFRDLYKVVSMPEMSILPGQIAFFLVLSIIPIISLVAIAGGFFSLSVETLTDIIQNRFPTDISNIVIPLIGGRGLDSSMIIFLTFSFLIASNGAYSIIVASNMIYGKDAKKNMLKRRIKSIILTTIIVLLFIFVILVPTFGDKIVEGIGSLEFISETIYNQFSYLFSLLKWPISLLMFFITFKLIYTIAPDKQLASKYVNRGAVFTSLGWILITIVYSYYVLHFAHYDLFYGALSNIIILMFWIYLLSFIFVFGMCLNSNYYHTRRNTYIHKRYKIEKHPK
jgi:membrane protein